jgi:hypothetical protein
METLDRSVHDNFFNAVHFSFKPQLKSGGNPAHDRMPVKLRLSEKVSWLSQERSDAEQRLTAKFLVSWSFALFKDLKSFGQGNANTKDQLLKMRALHPNIIVPEESWNEQIESVRAAQGGKIAFCVYPSAHAYTFCDTVAAVAEKKTCWNGPGKN